MKRHTPMRRWLVVPIKVAVLINKLQDKKVTDRKSKTAATAAAIKKQGIPKTKYAPL